ncbi:MAG: exodeoxyribonuclease VII small subunit [Longimicrobiales bacterium]
MSGAQRGGLEAHLDRLERIVGELSREDLELEQSLALFEEGVEHLREAERLLRAAELRVSRLVDEGGEPTLEPMDPSGR